MKHKLIWLCFLILLFISSYFREVLFRSINALMEGKDFFYAKTVEINTLKQWSTDELNRLKYLLTIAFGGLFVLLSYLGLKYSFPRSLAAKVFLLYASFISVLGLLGLFAAKSVSDLPTVYPFLRKLIGFIHTPLPYLIISATFYAYQNIKPKGID